MRTTEPKLRGGSARARPPIPHALGALAALAAALSVTPAAAQPATPKVPVATASPSSSTTGGVTEVEGAVLAVQGDELILDLGAARGAFDGASVEIWRPIKLKHPVTGKVLTDRFRIGTLELLQVRRTMALAKATAPLARPAEVGDVVILALAKPAPATPTPLAPEATAPHDEARPAPGAAPSPPEDPEARAVTEMFDALRGADLWTRVRRYEALVAANPNSRFARVLSEEAAALRELIAGRRTAAAEAPSSLVSFTPPAEARAGSPVRIAVELDGAAAGAVLQIRRKGAPSYAPLPMRALGHGYFAVDVPADVLVAPAVEYFVEATSPDGKATPVVGKPSAPEELDIFETPRPAPPRHHPSRVEISTDYADYNRLRGNDYSVQTEGLFGVRYGDVGVRAVSVGWGIFRGVGGSVDDLDTRGLTPRSVGLTYGWLEGEFGIVRAFSMGGRLAVGLLDSGVSGGGAIMVRIGSDLSTNLVLNGEILGGLGLRGSAQVELATFPRVPILLRAEVTNQPAGVSPSTVTPGTSGGTSNIGGRGVAQAGYRFTPSFTVSARASFEGRTIQHAGPGFGGAVGYTW